MASVTSINNYSEFTVKQRKKLYPMGPIPHRAAPYGEFFSWGNRHHCPMEVSAYVHRTWTGPARLNGFCSIQYDTSCYLNVRSKADMSQLNLPLVTNN